MHTRLKRLEQRTGGRDDGCPACRVRRACIVMTTSQRLPDGTTAPESDCPAPCAACGAVLEQFVEIVMPVVDGRGEAADRPGILSRVVELPPAVYSHKSAGPTVTHSHLSRAGQW